MSVDMNDVKRLLSEYKTTDPNQMLLQTLLLQSLQISTTKPGGNDDGGGGSGQDDTKPGGNTTPREPREKKGER